MRWLKRASSSNRFIKKIYIKAISNGDCKFGRCSVLLESHNRFVWKKSKQFINIKLNKNKIHGIQLNKQNLTSRLAINNDNITKKKYSKHSLLTVHNQLNSEENTTTLREKIAPKIGGLHKGPLNSKNVCIHTSHIH